MTIVISWAVVVTVIYLTCRLTSIPKNRKRP
jgi:hypothetical protein